MIVTAAKKVEIPVPDITPELVTLIIAANEAATMLDYIEQLELEFFTNSAERYALTEWGKKGRQYEPCYFCRKYTGTTSLCSKYHEMSERSCFELRGAQKGGEQ